MKSKARTSKGSKKSTNGINHKSNGAESVVAHKDSNGPTRDAGSSGTSFQSDDPPGLSILAAFTPQEIAAASLPSKARSDAGSIQHTSISTLQQQRSENPVGLQSGAATPQADKMLVPATSMETEFIEALYFDLADQGPHSLPIDHNHNRVCAIPSTHGDLPPHASSDSEDIDYDDMDSNEDQGDDGDCEDFDDDLDVYERDDFLSSQEAILMELRREQVEFEENVRQLQQQLLRQGSLIPLSTNEELEAGILAHGDIYSDIADQSIDPIDNPDRLLDIQQEINHQARTIVKPRTTYACKLCCERKTNLCLEKSGWAWRPLIIEAMATAAAAIANFNVRQHRDTGDGGGGGTSIQRGIRYSEYLQRPMMSPSWTDSNARTDNERISPVSNKSNGATLYVNSPNAPMTATMSGRSTLQPVPIRHMYRGTTPPPPATLYPLPANSPYKFGRKSSELLEPVGEFHEFQSAEGNSRQVLLHVWPPSSLDTTLLQKLEACCRDFQENDIVRGHSGDGFLTGWRPSWKQPHQTGVLRFGHWRVRAPPEQGGHLYPPFQTPLTLAAGGGSVLGSTVNMSTPNTTKYSAPNGTSVRENMTSQQQQKPVNPNYQTYSEPHCNQHSCPVHDTPIRHTPPGRESKATPDQVPGSQFNPSRQSLMDQHIDAHGGPTHIPQDLNLESSTQGRLLRLIRAIQMVEKGIIARHLKYLFPTLYEKYHGLQFGTPRLFDAVATVALAMDVSPRLHHDKAHTKHGFCWIVACGDFVGGDLCIPQLGKRVVMRPGTVVAIRSTVVAYYLERYAKNTSMYVMYAYTSDNNWPPAT
ncbi:hypothetical protein BG011_005504 [Mortierella polycephala]|uniref:Uncharacterized protein n=1 Tax=Mortierella polycephala TaxID=41804 RepID=A0A9P6PX20_9FUNG|nr:hypothetical protein BG011_005504 [Mortierella polycephala]